MKKILFCLLVLGCSASGSVFASVEQYVAAVEKISNQYKQETRNFFSGLDARQSNFTPQQQVQFCGIVGDYVERLYQAEEKKKEKLERQIRQMTKQDVIDQVMSSKAILILKNYNVQCDLK